ncbi:hypothetical protein LTR66_016602 [Elasticomyces elasticus]|nr:hypothetical protein LTR66_016602 [Elasticomyces elasticus]
MPGKTPSLVTENFLYAILARSEALQTDWHAVAVDIGYKRANDTFDHDYHTSTTIEVYTTSSRILCGRDFSMPKNDSIDKEDFLYIILANAELKVDWNAVAQRCGYNRAGDT